MPREITMRDLSTVFHLGSMEDVEPNPERKAGSSYEGNTLSVSVHPRAWQSIARLGGLGIYKLRKDAPKWCDAYDENNRKQALEWAVHEGLLEPASLFRLWQTDADGEPMFVTFSSRQDALEEAFAMLGVDSEEELAEAIEDEGENIRVEEVPGHTLTDKGRAYWDEGCAPGGDAADWVVVWWAEAQGFDGVWWEEDFNPAVLSAPRGGIFQAKLSSWEIRQLKKMPADADDDEG